MDKLNSLAVWEVKDKAVITTEGFVISYNLELHSSKTELPSVQVVLSVRYEGQLVAMWGCMGEQDQQQVVDFFLTANFKASTIKDKANEIYKRRGIELFEKL